MLLNCVAYEEGARLVDLPVEEISDYLDKPSCFVWVALRDPSPQELDTMRLEFDLHPLAVEDASHGHRRPKVEEFGGALFVVLQLVDFADGELEVGQVAVFAGQNYVLSVRSGSSQNFLGVRGRCEREPQLLKQGSGYVLYALMDAVVDRYFPILELLQTELESIEERIFIRGATRVNVQRLYELKRKVQVLKHAVSPLLQVSGRLHGARVPKVCEDTQPYFRDVSDHLARIDAAIFAVATAFAGIWGMNFEHMPELKLPWGSPAALAIIISTCSVVWWRFRRARWL